MEREENGAALRDLETYTFRCSFGIVKSVSIQKFGCQLSITAQCTHSPEVVLRSRIDPEKSPSIRQCGCLRNAGGWGRDSVRAPWITLRGTPTISVVDDDT
jgi:hypothetical protein